MGNVEGNKKLHKLVELHKLIEEAIQLEFNVAEIYLSFHHRFPEDAGFWWKIALEEKNHAALLRSGEQNFLDAGMFPSKLVSASLETLTNVNNELKNILKQEGGETPPSRAAAFNLAIRLEESAGEVHFQHAMQQAENPSDAIKLFQSLNEMDKNHADRMRSYMRINGIAINSN